MQRAFLTTTAKDARRNDDKDFLKRANVAQRKDCERIMKTAKASESGIIESMFEDVKPIDAAGQVNLF